MALISKALLGFLLGVVEAPTVLIADIGRQVNFLAGSFTGRGNIQTLYIRVAAK